MSIRDYPGFKWILVPTSNSNGDSYDVWQSNFCTDAVMSIEGKFFNILSMRQFETIHDAMEYIRNRAIINYFDNFDN
jgi:hypothetical protein